MQQIITVIMQGVLLSFFLSLFIKTHIRIIIITWQIEATVSNGTVTESALNMSSGAGTANQIQLYHND